MKKPFKSFITFSRIERTGLVALSLMILILLAVRVSMPYFVHPEIDTVQEQKLVAAWEKYKSGQQEKYKIPLADSIRKERNDYQDANDDNPNPLPYIININMADSETLVRLRGIGPKTAWKIINYRKTIGSFTSIDQLKEVCKMHKATFEALKKHLTVVATKSQ